MNEAQSEALCGIVAATFVVRARDEAHARIIVRLRSRNLTSSGLNGFEIVQVVPLEAGTFEVQATWPGADV
jgi:hypothetical protein